MGILLFPPYMYDFLVGVTKIIIKLLSVIHLIAETNTKKKKFPVQLISILRNCKTPD